MNQTRKLSPSERLILNSIRSTPEIHAGNILAETGVSIHTLSNALTRLSQIGLITKLDLGDGPRYGLTPEREAQ